MSPVYLNPPPSSPIPNFLEFKGEQLILQIHDQATSSSSISYQNLERNHTYDESLALGFSRHPQEIKVDKVLSRDKQTDFGQVFQSSTWHQNNEEGSGCSYGYSSNNPSYGDNIETIITNNNDQKCSRKWKPSKVRIMQKMMATSNKNMGEQKFHHDVEQQQSNISRSNNDNNNNAIRVCSDCHTTTTPLWRSGPRGPKSLCNACGIRQRKARRAAMAAAGFANNEGIVASMKQVEVPKPKAIQQDMRGRGFDNKSHPLPLKKRGKTVDAARTYANPHNDSKDYITVTSQRAFPRDEEEGAILLMALSCGLACSS